MGFRWRKSFRIFPGFRINLSHRGARGQIGGSPLSLSFRLFGGSKQRRVTASLPGTGLSFVSVSTPRQPQADTPEIPFQPDYQAAMREAFSQAAQLRLIPIKLEQIATEAPDTRREIVTASIPIFVKIMAANGVSRDAAKMATNPLADFDDAKLGLLIAEVSGVAPAAPAITRYPRARRAIV